jgi:hypothetical protein
MTWNAGAEAEGWYRDPYGIHQDRWFSAGTPTALVRDGGVEGHDGPPDQPPAGPLVEIPDNDAFPGDDLRRADEAEAVSASADDLRRADEQESEDREYDPREAARLAFDASAWGALGAPGEPRRGNWPRR